MLLFPLLWNCFAYPSVTLCASEIDLYRIVTIILGERVLYVLISFRYNERKFVTFYRQIESNRTNLMPWNANWPF